MSLPVLVGVDARPVWASNFYFELCLLQDVAVDVLYVAVNVQYPGVVHGTMLGKHPDALTVEEHYAAIKANIDELKPLQVGIFVHNVRRQYVI
ncbi:hypothetical protein ABZP36_034609 [Zizania latifolia]